MSHKAHDPDQPIDWNGEFRTTVLKSGFTGVAASVLAVVLCSPAGLGGMIGTSIASNLFGEVPTSDGHRINFPAPPAPISAAEMQNIRAQLDNSAAQIDNMRAATDAEMAYIRDLARSDTLTASIEPTHVQAANDRDLELADLLFPSEPV